MPDSTTTATQVAQANTLLGTLLGGGGLSSLITSTSGAIQGTPGSTGPAGSSWGGTSGQPAPTLAPVNGSNDILTAVAVKEQADKAAMRRNLVWIAGGAVVVITLFGLYKLVGRKRG